MFSINIPHMAQHSLLVSVGLTLSICTLSAIGGGILKLGADNGSWALFALSLGIYSCSSLGVFLLFRSGAATHFATTMFIMMLGGILATQVLSVVMGETFNPKAFCVLVIASFALAWSSQEQTTNNTPDISISTNGDLHEQA